LSFETAQTVFYDPLAFLRPDAGSHGEDRWQIIGKVNDVLIALVVFVVRDKEAETFRIISARRVTNHERKYYEEG
jgi:uncharacterized DUF497 family protein